MEETDEDDQGGEIKLPKEGEAEEGPQAAVMASAKAAVTVAHGSFNPMHNHHIAMMIAARKRLEDEGFTVLKGFMGLTSQSALKTKCEWVFSEEKGCIASGRRATITKRQGAGYKATFKE